MKTKLQKLKEKAVNEATANMLKKYPECLFCHGVSTMCHHIVHQSRSNYLKCDERNLVPICNKCHMRLHSGYEGIMILQLEKIKGSQWRDSLIKDSQVKIKSNVRYWESIIKSLKTA